jgi:hypothetical protein
VEAQRHSSLWQGDRLQRREPLRALLVPMDTIFDLLQTAICDPLAERRWEPLGKPRGHMAL